MEAGVSSVDVQERDRASPETPSLVESSSRFRACPWNTTYAGDGQTEKKDCVEDWFPE